jgi:hypothetical protein
LSLCSHKVFKILLAREVSGIAARNDQLLAEIQQLRYLTLGSFWIERTSGKLIHRRGYRATLLRIN